MGFPRGVETVLCTWGRFNGPTGRPPRSVKVEVQAIIGNANSLVWQATGDTMVSVVAPHQSANFDHSRTTPVVEVSLPAVDQPGWVDGSGGAVTGWHYLVTAQVYFDSQPMTLRRLVAPIQGQIELDLDSLPSDDTVGPIDWTPGTNQHPIEFRVTDDQFQWRYTGTSAWHDAVSLDDLPYRPDDWLPTPFEIGAQPEGDYLTESDLPDLTIYATSEDLDRVSDSIPTTPSDIGAQPEGDYALTSALDDLPYRPDDWTPTHTQVGAASAAQGDLADSAVQPGDLADVATSGEYSDLDGTPDLSGYATTSALSDVADTVPTEPSDIGAQPAGDYASAAQGSLADSAVQPNDLAEVATSGAYSDLRGTPSIPDVSGLVETTDPRLSDARTPTAHEHDLDEVDGLQDALDEKVPYAEVAPAELDGGILVLPDAAVGAEATSVALGNLSGTHALSDYGRSTNATLTLTGDATLTLPSNASSIYTLTLIITQDSTGGHTLEIPGALVPWSVAPVPTPEPGATDIWHLMYMGNGMTTLVVGGANLGAPASGGA